MSLPIAITIADSNLFGCPHCGYMGASRIIEYGGAVHLLCGGCEKSYIAVGIPVTESPIGFTDGDSDTVYPPVVFHPRRRSLGHVL